MADIDFDNMQTITDAQMLKAIRHAIAHIAVGGQSYMINGRQFTRADLSKLEELKERYETLVAEAGSATGTLTAYASFNRQQ